MLATDRYCQQQLAHEHRYAFGLICKLPELTTAVKEGLIQHNLRFDQAADVTVVLDVPTGFARNVLERDHEHGRRRVVATWNPCPEYWEDLWDFQVDALIAGGCPIPTLAYAITQVAEGASLRLPSRSVTTLTVVERRILRLLAYGCSNQEIAAQLSLSHQTVRNNLTAIYEKLQLKSRGEAILHYWGMSTDVFGHVD